jgi:hypothetical protein
MRATPSAICVREMRTFILVLVGMGKRDCIEKSY